MDILKQSESLQEQMVKWRRDLHQIPEVELNLPMTSKYVQERLGEMGIEFVTMVNGSGIVAMIDSGNDGKTVALRADMDALPIAEEACVEFKSTNGNMHACGHDSHTSMLLGAAKILNDNKELLNGKVKLIFQPGEENPGGAKLMIKEGCLEGVDAIFGQHIGCLFMDKYPSGKLIVSHGNAMACRDAFKIKIIGRGAHSSTPEDSVDPIAVAAQVINGIYMIKARENSALSPAVISVCMVHGGTASNIIPEVVELEGSTRAIDQDTREMIAKRIEDVTKNICEAFSAKYEYEFIWDYDITTNNPNMADVVINAATGLGLEEDVVEQSKALMGSEDMSFYLNEVPGAYYFLSSIVKQDGVIYGHHNPKFMLDESVFYKGAAMLAKVAYDFLNKNVGE